MGHSLDIVHIPAIADTKAVATQIFSAISSFCKQQSFHMAKVRTAMYKQFGGVLRNSSMQKLGEDLADAVDAYAHKVLTRQTCVLAVLQQNIANREVEDSWRKMEKFTAGMALLMGAEGPEGSDDGGEGDSSMDID